jgi:hypothetical protein
MTDFVSKQYVNSRGVAYQQFFQKVPIFQHFYTRFEAEYDPLPIHGWMGQHWEIPIGFVVVYLLGCYFGMKFMNKIDYKKIWDTRNLLSFWNFLLCTFSFVGALRTVPPLLHNITTMPFVDTICRPGDHDWGVGATGLWVQLFCLSKIPELIDTFFIVQRKRPLIFLHWYHHVTVLLYCWHAYTTEASQALYFVAMNYSVHAVSPFVRFHSGQFIP